MFVFEGTTDLTQWFVPNVAAHRAMLEAAGFDVVRDGPTYAVPFGPSHPTAGSGALARLAASRSTAGARRRRRPAPRASRGAAVLRLAIVADTHLPRGSRRLPDACVEILRGADLILHAGRLHGADVR